MKNNTIKKRRGRPLGSKNKPKTLSPSGRVHRTIQTSPVLLSGEDFNFDNLRDDLGVLAPKDEDIREELDLMGTTLN